MQKCWKIFLWVWCNQFYSRQFDIPDFAIVTFQSCGSKIQTKEARKFDHCNVKNNYLKNGRNEVFPHEKRNLVKIMTILRRMKGALHLRQ